MKYLCVLFLIIVTFPFLAFEKSVSYSQNSCGECHTSQLSEKVVHPAAQDDCEYCHAANGAEHPGEAKGFNLADTYPELCYLCHESKNDMAYVHLPVSDGDCAMCHSPHSSEYPNLLSANFPEKRYTESLAENFELCFLCHDSELLTAEKTEYATNFRNGSKNLHYLHIMDNRGRKCTLCHNVHQAPNEHLLEESISFGNWQMPLGLELNETGGSCATGCHKRQDYNREID